MDIILISIISIVLLLFLSGGYVFSVACLRRKELPWLIEDEIKNTSYGKYYHYIVAANQWLQENGATDISVLSHDGLKLCGMWVPAENAKGTILLAHGYRSTMLVDFGIAFPFYHELGFNLLIPNQRAHGKSQGRFITFGVKESEDMCRWIEYHNTKFGMKPMVISGLSMGASTVLYMADKELPDNVRGIIADCGFTSPADIIQHVFKKTIHLPAIPSIWVTDLFARIFAGFSIYEKDTRKTLKNAKVPVLMIHGMKDGFVPYQMSEEGFSVCVEPKKLFLVEDADHGLSFIKEKERYTSLVIDFLNQYILRKRE